MGASSWRLGLSLVLALLGPFATASEEDIPTVRLIWSDPHRQLPWSPKGIFAEVQSLLEDMGVSVDWCCDELGGTEVDGITVRVLLRAGTSEGLGLRNNAMGAGFGFGAPGENVFVFLPNVLRALDFHGGLEIGTSPISRVQIHRALARVITHELIHAVLPRRPHDEHGIFGFQLNRPLLLTRKITAEKETIEAFVARVREARR